MLYKINKFKLLQEVQIQHSGVNSSDKMQQMIRDNMIAGRPPMSEEEINNALLTDEEKNPQINAEIALNANRNKQLFGATPAYIKNKAADIRDLEREELIYSHK